MAYGESMWIHYEFCVMVIEAGNMYIQHDGTYEQNAIIKEVIQGCKYEEGTEITIVGLYGCSVTEEGEVKLMTPYGRPPFRSGEKYLLFCEESELSAEMEKPQFRTIVGSYSYLSLSNNNVVALEENPTVDEILNSEFVVRKMLSAPYVLEYKQEILEYYGVSAEGTVQQPDTATEADG